MVRIKKTKTTNNSKTINEQYDRLSLYLPGIMVESKTVSNSESNTDITKEFNTITQHLFQLSDESQEEKKDTIIIPKIKEKDEEIKSLKNKLNKAEEKLQNLLNKSRRVVNPQLNMIDIINNKDPQKRKVQHRCMWDHYNFDSMPFFLPFKYLNEKFHVYGCFCSPECTMAYNNHRMSDNNQNIKERNSLINQMAYQMTGSDEPIKPADNYEVLNDYPYGYLSIDEYRNNLKLGLKEYIIYIPPMVPVIPKIEEDYIDKFTGKSYSIFSSGNTTGDKFKLQRTKPLPNEKNNIINTLGLRVKKRKN